MEPTREDIERYAEEHTTPPPPSLAELAAETTEKMDLPGMMVGPVEGRFLETLVAISGARRVLEIGMFTGYSALSMAAALPPDGTLITCDINPASEAVARRHIEASPFADRIEIRMGPALETIEGLDGLLDFVFIDADKTNYRNYYEAVLPKLANGGFIAVDNVLWRGRVLDVGAQDDDGDTRAIAEFNDFVRNDPRVVCVMLTVRDGVTLIRRR
ncbi:MAG TPA: class I SAM-dependent methyltransferase [Acidimicrobiales bacterium]|nr:class I SAM-dependent methyltransferase [Acidimicrobiales bacterium]